MNDVRFEIEVELAGDPDDVWDLIVTPETLGDWLGGDVDLDPAEGAEGTVWLDVDTSPQHDTAERNAGDGPEPTHVIVEELVPAERFAFRWASSRRAPSRVEIELEPAEAGTRVRIVERSIPNGLVSPTLRLRACVETAA